MNRFESPIQFDLKKKIGDFEIEYINLMEFSQGGPEVGNISINGRLVNGRFGGPSICEENDLYVPMQVKAFLGTGFKLTRINITTLKVEYLSKIKDLIFLDKIVGNEIYFFEDMDKTIQSRLSIR